MHVKGKQAMIEKAVLTEKVMTALGDSMPPNKRAKAGEIRIGMELCKSIPRQRVEGIMHRNSYVSSHCWNHSLNFTEIYLQTAQWSGIAL